MAPLFPRPPCRRGSSGRGCCRHQARVGWKHCLQWSSRKACTPAWRGFAPTRACSLPLLSVAHGSRGMTLKNRPAQAMSRRVTCHDCRERLRSSPEHAASTGRQLEKQQARAASWLTSLALLLAHSVIAEDLHALVVCIHDKHAIVAIDEQSRRQLKVASASATAAEVVQQTPFCIEDLNNSKEAVDDVVVPFRIHSDSLGTEHVSTGIAELTDRIVEVAGAIEELHAKIHRIDDRQGLIAQEYFGWKVELSLLVPGLSELLQNLAVVHVERENLVPQGIRYVDSVSGGVDRDSGGTFEVPFTTLDAADRAAIFPVRIEDEDFAALRVCNVDVVPRVHRHTLRLEQRIPVFVFALDEFVLVVCEIKDMDADRTGVGDDRSTPRVDRNTVRTHHTLVIWLARDRVHQLSPEAGLAAHFALGTEAHLPCELASAFQQQVGRMDLGGRRRIFFDLDFGGRNRDHQQNQAGNRRHGSVDSSARSAQKKLNHRDIPK